MTISNFKSDILPHYKAMWNIAYAVLGNSDDASDAVQEGMVRLWARRDTLDSVSNVAGYCACVARNIALTMLQNRKSAADIDIEASKLSMAAHGSERMEWRHEVDAVMQAITNMPPNQREVMRLSAMAELDNNEIAEVTGLSRDNVRQLLSRGRKKLRQLFPDTLLK